MPTPDQHLSLAALHAYDPTALMINGECRFCCPLPSCSGQPINRAHRTMTVNSLTGLYKCQRCGEKGKVTEKREDRPPQTRQIRNQTALRRFSAPPAPPVVKTPSDLQKLDQWFSGARLMLPNTPGADYLQSRGIPYFVAWEAGLLFHPAWHGKPSVVFPILDAESYMVAAQGRSITTTDKITHGNLSCGIFKSHPSADEMQSILVTEAPIDALSISAAGYAAVALCGTTIRPYLLDMLFGKTLLLAFDADEAGERAADLWTKAAALSGAKVQRVRPQGGKDWNEVLMQQGADGIAAQFEPYDRVIVVRRSRVIRTD